MPSDSGLAEAQQERDDLHALAVSAGLKQYVPTPADLSAVDELLRLNTPIQLPLVFLNACGAASCLACRTPGSSSSWV